MLNVLGGNKVYTVPEIDALLKRTSGFAVVDKLPKLINASASIVYYKKIDGTVIIGYKNPDDPDDIADEEDAVHTEPVYAPVLRPYIKHTDPTSGDPCWYTTDSMTMNDTLTEEEVLEIWNSYEPKFTKLNTTRHIVIKED